MSRGVAVLAGVTLWALAHGALAQEPPLRVHLLSSPSTGSDRREEALARMRGELEGAGLRVALGEAAEGDAPEVTIARTRASDPDAAVIVLRPNASGSGLSFWVHEPWSARTTRVPLPDDPTSDPLGIRRAAVQAAEVIRAALDARGLLPARGMGAAPGSAPGSVGSDVAPQGDDAAKGAEQGTAPADAALDAGHEQPSDSEDSEPASRADGTAPSIDDGDADPATRGWQLGLALGPGLLQSFHGLGTTLTPVARVSARPPPAPGASLSVGLRASVAVLGEVANLRASQGRAEVQQRLVTGGAVLRFRGLGLLHPLAHAELGAYGVSIEGKASAPFTARSELHWAPMLQVGAGLELAFVSHLALTLEAQALATPTRTRIRIAGDEAAATGSPMVLVTLLLMGRSG